MPRHLIVATRIGQEIYRAGQRYGSKFLQSDKLVLNKAWTGFKHKSSIVAGIRTGLTLGGGLGTFLVNNDDELDVATPYKYESQTGSPYKTRSGRRGWNYSRRCKCDRLNRYKRRSSFR